MEAIQCTENTSETVTVKLDQNRILKRNIGDLAIDGKLNEEFKSPARKEVKISHEFLLQREEEQWKELLKEKGIQQSVAHRGASEILPQNSDDILKDDQKTFIAEAVDVSRMLEQSNQFRHKFDFFLRVNKIMLGTITDRSEEAHDKGKQQAITIRTEKVHCEKFQPL